MVSQLAYCAGVMDSDGHIGVHVNWYRVRHTGDAKQPSYAPRCSVKQIDPEAVSLFHDLFGGHRYMDTTNVRGSKRPICVWQVSSRAAGEVIRTIRPFLRIKVRQADLALELCALNQSPRRRAWVLPEIVDGEPLVPLAEACERAGRSYAVGVQSVKLRNIPFLRQGRRIFVPESYIDEWRTRGPSAMRRPEVTERMAAITEAIRALNSGKRGLPPVAVPTRY